MHLSHGVCQLHMIKTRDSEEKSTAMDTPRAKPRLLIRSSRLLPAGKTRNGPAARKLPAHIPILY